MNEKKPLSEQALAVRMRRIQAGLDARNISIHVSDRNHYNLTLNIYNCGNQDYVMEQGGKPDHYILYYVKEGRGTVVARQMTHKVEAGQGFVIYPQEEMWIRPNYKDGMNVTWVAFSGYLVEQYLGRANLTSYEPVFKDNDAHDGEKMFDDLLRASMTFPNRYCKMMAQLYSIFGFLLDNVSWEARPNEATAESYLVKALDFIDTNFFEDITVNDIAAWVGLSRKALTSVFTGLTGFTVKDYLIYYRITRAVNLLRSSKLSIEQVAESVGYKDQFYFSKQFKKNVGMTPSECRRKMAKEPDWEYVPPIDTVRQQYSTPFMPETPPEF